MSSTATLTPIASRRARNSRAWRQRRRSGLAIARRRPCTVARIHASARRPPSAVDMARFRRSIATNVKCASVTLRIARRGGRASRLRRDRHRGAADAATRHRPTVRRRSRPARGTHAVRRDVPRAPASARDASCRRQRHLAEQPAAESGRHRGWRPPPSPSRGCRARGREAARQSSSACRARSRSARHESQNGLNPSATTNAIDTQPIGQIVSAPCG